VQAEAEIRRVIAELGRCIESRDFDAAAASFAPDAVLMLPGSPMVHGSAAIGSTLAVAFGAGSPVVEVSVTRVEVAASGELAFAIGTGVTHAATALGSKWVAVLRRHDGAWKIVVDAFNADVAPAG
jgi:uncharacterized protein (TIGR02246 family)